MTREEAIRRIENHIRINSRQEPFRACLIQEALEMAVDALKAHETSLEQLAEAYGLTVDGVQFALEQYQTVICEITHSRLSKLSYFADDILRLANDLQCEGCELEPRVMTLEELITWQKKPIVERDPIYVEYREGKGFGAPHWAQDNFGFNVASCSDNYRSGAYGMLIRCWTSRPTDAQREAVPWI